MTEKRFLKGYHTIRDKTENKIYDFRIENVLSLLNNLHEENKYLKIRFKEEQELTMKISRECDALTIKKQELELEIIRLEKIIKTGDGDDYNRTS